MFAGLKETKKAKKEEEVRKVRKEAIEGKSVKKSKDQGKKQRVGGEQQEEDQEEPLGKGELLIAISVDEHSDSVGLTLWYTFAGVRFDASKHDFQAKPCKFDNESFGPGWFLLMPSVCIT